MDTFFRIVYKDVVMKKVTNDILIFRKNQIAKIIYIVILILFTMVAFLLDDNDCKIALQIMYILSLMCPFLFLDNANKNKLNLIYVFYFLLFFFGGSTIILDLVDFCDMSDLDFFYNGKVSSYTTNRTIFNYILTNYAIIIGYLLHNRVHHNCMPHDANAKISNFIIYIIFLIGFIAQLYSSYLQFSFLSAFSYHESFISGVSVPIYIRVFSQFPLFACIYKLMQGRKRWFFPLVFYCGLVMLTGQRGPALLILIVVFYLCYRKGIVKTNVLKIFVGGFLLLLISIIASNLRNGKSSFTDEDSLLQFIWGQGGSITVLQIAIQNEDKLDYNFKDLFGNVYSAYRFLPLTDVRPSSDKLTSVGKQYKVWSKYISYETNPNMYYAGMGLGGNYIAQMFCVGKEFAVIISGILIGLILTLIDNRLSCYKNPYRLFFIFSFLRIFLYAPRDNFFSFLTFMTEDVLALLIIYFIVTISKWSYGNKKCLHS